MRSPLTPAPHRHPTLQDERSLLHFRDTSIRGLLWANALCDAQFFAADHNAGPARSSGHADARLNCHRHIIRALKEQDGSSALSGAARQRLEAVEEQLFGCPAEDHAEDSGHPAADEASAGFAPGADADTDAPEHHHLHHLHHHHHVHSYGAHGGGDAGCDLSLDVGACLGLGVGVGAGAGGAELGVDVDVDLALPACIPTSTTITGATFDAAASYSTAPADAATDAAPAAPATTGTAAGGTNRRLLQASESDPFLSAITAHFSLDLEGDGRCEEAGTASHHAVPASEADYGGLALEREASLSALAQQNTQPAQQLADCKEEARLPRSGHHADGNPVADAASAPTTVPAPLHTVSSCALPLPIHTRGTTPLVPMPALPAMPPPLPPIEPVGMCGLDFGCGMELLAPPPPIPLHLSEHGGGPAPAAAAAAGVPNLPWVTTAWLSGTVETEHRVATRW